MAALIKTTALLFLLCLPGALCFNFADSIPAESTPSVSIICTVTKENEELDCNGKTFIFEAQDAVGSARWFIDLLIVLVLVVFAGTPHFA